jgi:outer membrane protein assembly factor BamB
MKRLLVGLVLVACLDQTRAGDAPQFRGGGSGVSAETDLPLTWSATEHLRWKADLPGRGLSNPVVAGGRVFVTASSRVNQDRLHVLCFDARDGKQLWERQFWATGLTQSHPKTNMAAPTPVVDGRFVYALFATADLICLDRDGNLVWARSLTGDYPTVGNNVGLAASPVLVGNTLVVHLENVGESFVAGVDPATGQNRWRLERPRGLNWNTPLALAQAEPPQVVLMSPRELTAHDASTGRVVWTFDGSFSAQPSVAPGDGMLFVPGAKLTALKIADRKPEIVWQNPKLNPGFSSPVAYCGQVYTVTNRGVVSCAEAASGKLLWTHRVEGTFSASPLAGAGRVYFVSEEGPTYVMEAGPEAKLLATNELHDTFMASPVAADRALYLRSDKHLYCVANP